jgi:uncharacterized OB-fold protein
MVRGIVRGGAYLPRFTDGRRRVRGNDEDLFTLAATALERTAGPFPAELPQLSLRTVGASDPELPQALASVVGARLEPGPVLEPASSFGEALQHAARGKGPEWVVVVNLDGRGPEASACEPPGEGSVALLIDDRDGALPLGSLAEGAEDRPGGHALAQLFGLVQDRPDREVWVGDWHAEPGAGIPAPGGSAGDPSCATISQGAFVPSARDEENRPSRWRFLADRCGRCAARTFPARGRCRSCGATEGLRPERLPLDGATVVASTWIGRGGQPTEFDAQVESSGPYGVVLAELAPDAKVTLSVADARPEEMRIGAKVDTVLRRLYPMEGRWRYGRKAVPARSAAAVARRR